jgi:hypothetical protein
MIATSAEERETVPDKTGGVLDDDADEPAPCTPLVSGCCALAEEADIRDTVRKEHKVQTLSKQREKEE